MTWSRAVGGLAAGADAADADPAGGGGSATGCRRPPQRQAPRPRPAAGEAGCGQQKSMTERPYDHRPVISSALTGCSRSVTLTASDRVTACRRSGAKHKQMLRLVTLALHL